MRLIPSRAYELVVIILADIPDVLSLQVMFMASIYSSNTDRGNMNTRNSTKCQFRIVIKATDAPNTTNVAQVSCIRDSGSLISIRLV